MPLGLRKHVLGTSSHAKSQSKKYERQVLANATTQMTSAGLYDFSRFGFPRLHDHTSVFEPTVEALVSNAGACTEAILGVLNAEEKAIRRRFADDCEKLEKQAGGLAQPLPKKHNKTGPDSAEAHKPVGSKKRKTGGRGAQDVPTPHTDRRVLQPTLPKFFLDGLYAQLPGDDTKAATDPLSALSAWVADESDAIEVFPPSSWESTRCSAPPNEGGWPSDKERHNRIRGALNTALAGHVPTSVAVDSSLHGSTIYWQLAQITMSQLMLDVTYLQVEVPSSSGGTRKGEGTFRGDRPVGVIIVNKSFEDFDESCARVRKVRKKLAGDALLFKNLALVVVSVPYTNIYEFTAGIETRMNARIDELETSLKAAFDERMDRLEAAFYVHASRTSFPDAGGGGPK